MRSKDRWLTDPKGVIVDTVAEVEPALDSMVVESLIGVAIPHRPRQRDLARALTEDPDLLVSGRPVGPRALEKLTRALREHGATVVAVPRCGRCGKPNPLPSWHGEVRVCAPCYAVLRAESRREPCSGCGRVQVVRQRDRDGRPRCQACPVEIDPDPVAALVAIVRTVEPTLTAHTISEAVTAAVATAYEQQRLVWALRDQPGLLTAGGQGSRRLRTFIDELQAWGARTIAAPRCPFCAASVSLNWTVDGVHWCRACWQRKTRIKPCTRCGRQRPVAARAPEGGVLCSRCHRGHPANHEPCSRCRRVRLIVRRDEDQRLCDGCYRPPTAVCASCGRRRPCYFADTDSPRCEPCSARRRAPQPCSGCGHVRPVNARDAGGKPLCASCSRPTALCHGCGKTKYLGSPLPDGRRLCFYCRSKDPTAARPCVGCGAVAVPYHHGLCPACACEQRLRHLLGGPDGQIRSELDAVYATLRASHPQRVLLWLRHSAPAGVLIDLASRSGPVTHEVLDQLRPVRSVQHLRAALVAAGALPPRDENLAHLPGWIDKTTARR